jgi:hypothetical protein
MEGIVMLPHHPAIAAALAEQRQADLRHDAEQARLARSCRLARRPRRWRAARRWWLLAQRPANA